jgi:hypothetical protein
LDLWNFGGFDVDALTADKNQEKDESYYGSRGDYRNESRLTSAFGNSDLNRSGYGGGRGNQYGREEYDYGRRQGGWDAIPRWSGSQAGQISYPGGMYQGYGGGEFVM